MILRIFFLFLSNVDVEFVEKLRKFIRRFYTVIETLFIINKIEVINKKTFAKGVFDQNSETFVIHVSLLEVLRIQSSRILKIVVL